MLSVRDIVTFTFVEVCEVLLLQAELRASNGDEVISDTPTQLLQNFLRESHETKMPGLLINSSHACIREDLCEDWILLATLNLKPVFQDVLMCYCFDILHALLVKSTSLSPLCVEPLTKGPRALAYVRSALGT